MNSQILDLRVRISDVFFLAASLHLSVLGTEAPAKAAKGTSISSAAIVSPSRPALGKITSSEYSEKSPNVRKVISPFPTTPAAISPPATLEQQSLSLLATERPAPSLTSNALSSSEDTTAQFTSQTEAEATGENAKAGVVPKMRAPKSAKEKMAFQKTTESRNVRPSTEMPSATGISKVSMALTIRTKRTTKPPYAPAFQSPATTMAVLRTKIRTFTSIDMDDYSDIEKFLDKVCQMLKSRLPLKDCEPMRWSKEIVYMLPYFEITDAGMP
uniref:Uncharacterized protein LOC117346020 n=1 Tax=Geotrypetes seraphini TaxID=260995 RepID=A0A6P8P6N1_GEOSA|nr:uncharacterized protein LOC117346020 [Geotrypetes seraphini]